MNGLPFRVPPVLRLHRVPVRAVRIAAAVSSGLLVGGFIEGLPPWGIALATLMPWFPVFCVEAAWQSRHYGLYAFFGALTLFQLGHMGEHTAELVQLFLNHGNLAQSHGVFGPLDNEGVHFFWNIGVWLGVAALLYRFGSRNPWLWVAFIAASIHMVEHFYLYWLYVFHLEFWSAGGSAGILGDGGLIGSPLARPYLHFVYNYLEVMPLVIAFWDQSWLVYDKYLARAFPTRSAEDLVAATPWLERLSVAPGTTIIRQGQPADRCYIVAKGEVEVLREDERGQGWASVCRPGQLFGAIGPRRLAAHGMTVRATQPTELLALERDAFTRLFAESSDSALASSG